MFRWRWTIEVAKAAPVCTSQELFSLFHLLLVGVPIPEVVVRTVLIVLRNFHSRSFFNFLFRFSLFPDVVLHRAGLEGGKVKLARSFSGLARTSPVSVAATRA